MQITATAMPKLGQMLDVTSMTDALANAAHESLALAMPFATDSDGDVNWPVVSAAIAVGAVVIGHWYAARRQLQSADAPQLSPFSVRHISD